ncbi:MAG: GTPase HflX [Candidatus Dormiibacterota bacterium]
MRVFDEARQKRGERVFMLARAEGEDDLSRVEGEMEELAELARTAGAEVVGSDIQRRARIDPALFFGRGKVAEVRSLKESLDFGLLLTNDELSPRQQRNLEDELEVPIVDRAGLILDVFAQHARSREGRIQVEAAQLHHLLPRLSGGPRRSRLGGGIGTRGPGEQQLETDRRRIRTRLRSLERDLDQVRESRALHRAGRQRLPFRTVALVGYTNAGKSSLLNSLTTGGARSENQLFATLDPTTRALTLSQGPPCLLIDTVGFIQKLPQELVTAFRATLEEVQEADLLVHVLDASHAGAVRRLETVHDTLGELGVGERPMIMAINKIDLCSVDARHRLEMFSSPRYRSVQLVSTVTGEGLDALRGQIADALAADLVAAEATISYQDQQTLQLWRRYGVVDSEEFTAEGIRVRGRLPEGMRAQVLSEPE